MDILTVYEAQRPLRQEINAWRRAAVGLLALSVLWNLIQVARIEHLETVCRETVEQLEQAELARDHALEQVEEMARELKQAGQAVQTAARETAEPMRYIGECIITSYCPCELCCGQWADGLTATGVPAVPGIVAVDPEVIPLGSTVVIDGREYLAADTGVTGLAVDVCAAGHQEAVAFGVQQAEVWVETGGEQHG